MTLLEKVVTTIMVAVFLVGIYSCCTGQVKNVQAPRRGHGAPLGRPVECVPCPKDKVFCYGDTNWCRPALMNQQL